MSWVLNFSFLLTESQAVCMYPMTLNGTALKQLTVQDFQHCFNSVSKILSAPCAVPLQARSRTVVVIFASVLVTYATSIFMIMYGCQGIKKIGQIQYNPKDIISLKNNVTIYKGKIQDNRLAAIKRYRRLARCKELDILLHLSESSPPHHSNVIHYMCMEWDSKHTYIALDLCDGDLKALVLRHNELHRYLTPETCLSQITNGIKFLHDRKTQHRDIKPQNILWKHSGAQTRFIISDFDLSHLIESESSGKCGSRGWTASELWNRDQEEVGNAVDIFSLGLVFYYVLTLGRHPFGPVAQIETCQQNISANKVLEVMDLNKYHDDFVAALAEDLILQMINPSASRRPDADSILKHPLFWDDGKMIDLYDRIGNEMEDKKSSSIKQLKENLERGASIVFEGNWKDSLEKIVRSEVSRFEGEEICGLLRVVRNKIVHYGRLREELREVYGNSPEGVVQYYNSHFPKLLLYAFRCKQDWIRSGN